MRLVVPTSTRRAPGAGEHVGNPEAVADLDQLPARDDDLAPFGKSGQSEHHGRGVVVDDERRLGARDPLQQPDEMILSRAARPCVEVVLQIRIAAANLDDAIERGLRERCPAEIRVDQDARGVEHAPQRWPAGRRQLRQRRLDEIARIASLPDLVAGAIERRASCGERERPRRSCEPRISERRGRRREAFAAKAPQPEV